MTTTLKQLFTSVGGTFLLRTTSAGLAFLISVLLAQYLGLLGFGVYSSAIALISLFAVVCTTGMEHFLVRLIAAYQAQRAWNLLAGLIQRTTRFAIAAGLILALVVVFLSYAFSLTYRQEVLYGAALLPILTALRLHSAILQGFHRVSLSLFPEFIVLPILFIIFITTLFYFQDAYFNISTVLFAQVIASSLALLCIGIASHQLKPKALRTAPPQFDTTNWLRVARPILYIGGITAVQQYIDIVMLSFLNSPVEVGLYRPALQVASLITFGSFAVIRGLRPIVSRLHAKGDYHKLQDIAIMSARVSLAFALPVGTIALAFDVEILSIFGPEFPSAAQTLKILIVGQIVVAAMGNAGIILLMTDYEKAVALGFSVAVISNITLNLILITMFGIEGAASATIISQILAQCIFVLLVYKKLNIHSTSFGNFFRRTQL